jgi:hypothetical protein
LAFGSESFASTWMVLGGFCDSKKSFSGHKLRSMSFEKLHYHFSNKGVAMAVYCKAIKSFAADCYLVDCLIAVGNSAEQNCAGVKVGRLIIHAFENLEQNILSRFAK